MNTIIKIIIGLIVCLVLLGTAQLIFAHPHTEHEFKPQRVGGSACNFVITYEGKGLTTTQIRAHAVKPYLSWLLIWGCAGSSNVIYIPAQRIIQIEMK